MHPRVPSPGRVAAVATLVVALLSSFAGSGVAQRAAAHLGLRAGAAPRSSVSFAIAGNLGRPAYPGRYEALDLRLSNRHRYWLRVSRVSIAITVDAKHTRAGCDRGRDLHTIRMPSASYPILLPPRRSLRLRALGVVTLPQVGMRSLPISQDACQGARLALRFGGRAARTGAPRR